MTRKCAICGLESEIEDALLPVRDSYYSDKIFYCPACSKKRSTQLGESYLIACVVLLVGGFVWAIARSQNEFAWLTFQSGLFMCFVAMVVAPHELGHVLAAFVTRARMFQVTVGLGRTLYKRDFLGIEWEFCAIPICGFTVVAVGDRKFYRTRSFLISLGGPLMNFLLGFAAIIALWRVSSPWLAAVIRPFIAANAFVFVFNLIPRKVNFAGTLMESDGLTLLNVLFMSTSKIDKEIETYYLWEGYSHSMRGRIEDAKQSYEKGLACFPDSVAFQSGMGRALLERGNYVDARSMFVQLQKNTDLKPAMAIHLLNNIATADVMMGTKELLDEADVFSQTACEKMPWQPEFKGTRGLVLAKKGHIEQGLALLKEAMDKTENSSHKAVYASYIAEFENKKSNAV
ncbi:MAG: site-2 protease family protein [Planctomycetes bacterium]|nr:site-2 protease family protein [Planctomycetota bacterium]